MAIKEIFNANTQQFEAAELSVDDNGEILARFKDESFIKLPAGLTANEAEKLLARQAEDNKLSETAAAVERARKESEIVIDELAGITATPTTEDVEP